LHLVPVLDLKDGQVVHAREGRREEYRAVKSGLCSGAEPERVIEGLLRLHPFGCLYVADLDAIQRRGHHRRILAQIRARYPALELWVDAGIGDEATLVAWMESDLGRPVIGSESLAEAAFMDIARQRSLVLPPVLSLDFAGDAFRGPGALLEDPARYWPERVLAMNLRRVGSGTGPDLTLIVALSRQAPGSRVYAAGGIRSAADLDASAAAGAAGALLATALHDGSIGSAELSRFSAACP
jgi:phosphoribosylformimino-5-aminoimidazole carboxamide ribotide isomerase